MNSFILKIIACITMFIDHIGYVVFGGSSWFNYIGRLAFPIFAFQISQGYIHTHNFKKYIIRLIVFALISQVPFMLFYSIFSTNFALNVIFTLIFGLLAILVYDKINKILGLAVAVLFGLFAHFLHCDYGFYGVAIVFLFYVFHNNKLFTMFSFLIATFVYYFCNSLEYYSYGMQFFKYVISYYLPFFVCTCLSILPILLYNKKKGSNTKYLLYLFYPLHLIFIYILSLVN